MKHYKKCSKDSSCSCMKCESSKNNMQEGLLKKTLDTAKVEIGKALPDVDPDMSGPFPGIGVAVNPLAAKIARNPTVRNIAGKIAGAVKTGATKVAQLAPSVVGESTGYRGSEKHLEDLINRHKEDLKNLANVPEKDSYSRMHLSMIAQKSKENVENHPLYTERKTSLEEDLNAPTEKPSNYHTHVVSFRHGDEGEHVGTWKGDKFIPNDPNHPVYGNNGSYQKREKRAPAATIMRDPHEGPPNEVHVIPQPTKKLNMNDDKSKNHWHEHHLSMAALCDNLAKTTGNSKKEKHDLRRKAAEHLDNAMRVRPELYTNPITGKPNKPHHLDDFEKYSPKPNLKENKMGNKLLDVTKTLPLGVEKQGPGEKYGTVDKSAPPPKDTSTETGIIAGETGEEKYKEIKSVKPPKSTDLKERVMDKYKALAEAAFGHLNNQNSLRTSAVRRLKEDHHLQEAASFRDISANRNVALESSIEQIMKESYKKKKMMEDAMNVYIATPEQREDWLNVGRGAMDVSDYINKYKV